MTRLLFYGLFLQCFFLSMLMASNTSAQRKSIEDIYLTVDLRDTNIKEALQIIEQNSEFYFAYSEPNLQLDPELDLRGKKRSLGEILRYISEEGNLRFKRVNETIHVYANPDGTEAVEEYIEVGQGISVSGRVTSSEDGEGIPGVNVIVQGTAQGTVTDIDGRYNIEVADESSVLVFSSVGFVQEEVTVGNKTVIDIELVPDVTALEEIVVVGYGTQTRRDLTSSIAVVESEDLTKIAAPSPFQQLQGRAPGVVVRTNSHSPGADMKVRIRGTGSISAGSQPLILVDQLRVDDINSVNPADIESMTVLKDASATAIYGAQGSNGVILITTKQGAEGKAKVSYDGYYGVQNVANMIDLVGAQEHAITINEYRETQGQGPLFTEAEINALGEGTDWQDVLYRSNAPIQNHSLSASGGTANTNYYISANFFDQQGVVRATDFRRYTVRANVGSQVSDKVKIGLNLNVASSVGNQVREGGGPSTNAGPVDAAFQFSPIHPVFNDDGSYTQNDDIDGLTTVDHPIQAAEDFYNENLVNNIFGNMFVQYEIIDGLVWNTDLGAGLRDTKNNQYTPINSLRGQGLGTAQVSANLNKNWRIFNTLTYRTIFADMHNVEVLVGQEAWESVDEGNWARARGFATDDLLFNNLGQGNGDLDDVNSGWSRRATDSYFGRLNYNYDNRYLLNFTIRNDGASVFGENFKRGWFPAVSLGYRISEEAFMQNSATISELKLKASYGVSGTPGVAPFRSLALIGNPLSSSPYSFGGQVAPIAGFTRLPNPDLQWEVGKQLNIGLTLGLLDDRILFTAEYYNRDTEDLLLPLPLSPSSGFTDVLANTASMNNSGVEFSINANILQGEFTWNINANASYNQNEVTSLGGGGEFTSSAGVSAIQNVNPVIVRIGEPIGAFFGLVTDGIFQTQEEVDNASLSNGTAPYGGAKPGTFRFVDQNGDTLMNDNDRVVLGSALPTWTGGITNTFSYMGFDLSIFMTFVTGNKILNLLNQQNEGGRVEIGTPTQTYFDNRWTGEGTSNEYQIPGDDPNYNRMYDLLLEDGSFLRAREITLGYNFNFANTGAGRFIDNLRLYLSVQNAFTITDYTGYDPDVQTFGGNSNIWNGIDRGAYPNVRTFLVGLNLGF